MNFYGVYRYDEVSKLCTQIIKMLSPKRLQFTNLILTPEDVQAKGINQTNKTSRCQQVINVYFCCVACDQFLEASQLYHVHRIISYLFQRPN